MIPLDRAWLSRHPLPQPGADTDKNRRGRVLAAGGSLSVPGALRLTGEAALRAGAGKLQLATVAPAALPLGMTMPEAAVFALPANPAGELGAEAAAPLAGHLERCDALVFGPGMGPESAPEPILEAVLAGPDEVALVIDAAAIAAAGKMAGTVARHGARIVLTPHPGEMALLMGCDEARARDEAEALAREAADRFRATVLLKGTDTWIACPGADPLHYPGGGPGLATGGSGDVLAGIIAGIIARGAPPRIAAGWGVWLHGEAGRTLATRTAPLGFLGRELPPEVPRLMASVQPDT